MTDANRDSSKGEARWMGGVASLGNPFRFSSAASEGPLAVLRIGAIAVDPGGGSHSNQIQANPGKSKLIKVADGRIFRFSDLKINKLGMGGCLRTANGGARRGFVTVCNGL
jgi:hypothetical protein